MRLSGFVFPIGDRGRDAPALRKRGRSRHAWTSTRRSSSVSGWDALAVYWPWSDPDGVAAAKRTFGDDIAVGGMVGGGLWAIDTVADWTEFSVDLMDHREKIHEQAEAMMLRACDSVDRLVDAGADFVFLPHDVAFNGGPFVSPKDFAEIVTPYLARLVERVKTRGAYAIFHSDGMLMPVLDQILSCQPHALQSIDPMAGMDIAEVKKLTYGKMALMGNVQCNLLQDGPEEAIRQSARYCLEHSAPAVAISIARVIPYSQACR